MNSLEIRAAISLAFVYVLRMLGLFMVIPVIAISSFNYPDYSPLLVGVAIGGYGLTQAILQIPMGVLSDHWGRKKVIYMGLVFFALGSIIAATADTMFWLVVGRMVQGAGAIAGAVMALAADVTREEQRSTIMAVIGVSIGFSFYIALLLGPVVTTHFGMNGIFYITATLTLCCIPIIKWGVPVTKNAVPMGDMLPKFNAVKTLAKDPLLWRLNMSVLLLHMMITCFFVQIPQMLLNIEFSLAQHWQLYLPILLLSVLLLAVMMKLTKRVAKVTSFRMALLLMLIGFVFFLADLGHWLPVVVAGILFFTGFNYLEANLPAMVSSLAPAGKKGSAMGVYASHQFFGAFLGGTLSGLLNTWLPPEYTFIFCSSVIIIWIVLLSGIANTNRIKRVSLILWHNQQQKATVAQNESTIRNRLLSLHGVKELELLIEENACYLKVDSQHFNIEEAKKVIQPI